MSPAELCLAEYKSDGAVIGDKNFYHFTLVISDQYLKETTDYNNLRECSQIANTAFDNLLHLMNNRLLNNHWRKSHRLIRLHVVSGSTEHRSKHSQMRCSTHIHAVVAVSKTLDKTLQTLLCDSYADQQHALRLAPEMHRRLPELLKRQIRDLRIDPIKPTRQDLESVISYTLKDASDPKATVRVVNADADYEVPNHSESFTTYKSKKGNNHEKNPSRNAA